MDTQLLQIGKLIKENIQKVIIGKDETIDLVLAGMIGGGHILLEDVPGTGKTMLSKALAKSLDADFARIQFTPDLLPSDVTGINYYNQKAGEFVFKKGAVFCNVLLADEINRATPRTQSSLLECMEEGQVTVDGQTRVLDKPFFVIATQNPIETAGTYTLPEAQLDRFMMKLSLGLPEKEEEVSIMERFLKNSPMESIGAVCDKATLVKIMSAVKDVYIHPNLMTYIADITTATRENKAVSIGVSPRGTLAMLNAARSYALIKGREYVIPEDIKTLAPVVLAHRMILRGGTGSCAGIIEDILSQITVPTEDWSK
ncbi:MAG: MoxR family ATPase [Eubacteriales bacterium]|nr:MoxR family ATPase [Eubacteriales bacterium]